MAHFAELDENNIVKRVIVVSNDDILDENGLEKEEVGIAFCKSLFGQDTNWVQTSYNNNFRGIYAMEGDLYDKENDVFVCLDKNTVYGKLEDVIDVEEVTPTPELESPVIE